MPSFHDAVVTNVASGGGGVVTGNMCATNTGDALYAFITQDGSPLTLNPPGGTNWTQVDAKSQSTPDGQSFWLFEYTGGAPASPAGSYTWTGGNSSATKVMIFSVSGSSRTRSFLTFTQNTTSLGSPISAGMTGGTTSSGDSILVCIGLDKTTQTDVWSYGTPTGSPGTFTPRVNSDSGDFWGCGLGTLDGAGAGATGTISYPVTQTVGTGGAGWSGWVFAIQTAALAPTINTQPQSTAVYSGQPATFTISATASAGGGSLSYQWTFNGSNVGTNSTTYTRNPTSMADNGGVVACTVTDSNGSTPSNNAVLNVLGVPPSAPAGGGTLVGGGPSASKRYVQ